MRTITGVPESLTRAQYLSLFESLGFDVKSLRRLDFRVNSVYAEVMEHDDDGHLVLDRAHDEVAVTRMYIPIVDKAPTTSDQEG